MLPVGTSDSGQAKRLRRYPFVIVPVAPPAIPLPADSIYMEALVFSRYPHPPERVLNDYCKVKALDPSKFKCHPVAFAKDQREGKGTLHIQKAGDRFLGRINWRA